MSLVVQHQFFAHIIDPQGLVPSVKGGPSAIFTGSSVCRGSVWMALVWLSCLSEYLDYFSRKAEHLCQRHLVTVLGSNWK